MSSRSNTAFLNNMDNDDSEVSPEDLLELLQASGRLVVVNDGNNGTVDDNDSDLRAFKEQQEKLDQEMKDRLSVMRKTEDEKLLEKLLQMQQKDQMDNTSSSYSKIMGVDDSTESALGDASSDDTTKKDSKRNEVTVTVGIHKAAAVQGGDNYSNPLMSSGNHSHDEDSTMPSPVVEETSLRRSTPINRAAPPAPGAFHARPTGGGLSRREESTSSHDNNTNDEDDNDTEGAGPFNEVSVAIPEATPITAELVVDDDINDAQRNQALLLEAKELELQQHKQEIERLKQQLQAMNGTISVAAPVAEVISTTHDHGTNTNTINNNNNNNNNRGSHTTSNDITRELESLVMEPPVTITNHSSNHHRRDHPSLLGSTNNRTKGITSSSSSETINPTRRQNQLRFAKLGLIGRQTEQEILVKCFERAISTITDTTTSRDKKTRELILISGPSGTGKTSLANTLQDIASQKKSIFISGKFDLYLRDEPFAGVATALQELCRDLSTIDEICQEILQKLGVDVFVLTKILPEMESIVAGRQQHLMAALDNTEEEEVQALDEAKKRIAYAFRRFFRVICTFFPCLVLSLDDLQWADLASLDLIESLMKDDDMSNLVVIGCYRSNEVDDSHLLNTTIRELKSTSDTDDAFHITEVAIGNLDLNSVNQMLKKLLSMTGAETMALAQLCHRKTHGNAFFLLQYISHLHELGLLEYSWRSHIWTWDLTTISSKTASTSNVVDLLKGKMEDLSGDVTKLLPILACMGSTVEESVLLLVWIAYCKESGQDIPVQPLLEAAVKEGFLEYTAQSQQYQFIHDKIQEASMSLLYMEEMNKLKSTIGKIVVKELDDNALETKLFVAANLLNEGLPPASPDDQLDLARLNLRAAKKAVRASAFASASKFALKGIEYLPGDKWDSHYKLKWELFSLAAEVEGYLGHFESMHRLCDEVKENAKGLADTFRVINCIQDTYLLWNRNKDALDLGLDLLRKLGHKFPTGKASMALSTIGGLIRMKATINSKSLHRIDGLPPMSDPMKMQAMYTLDKCITASYLLMHDVFPLLIFKNVQLTLRYGMSQYSSPAFAALGYIIVGVYKDFDTTATLVSTVEKMKETQRHSASRATFVLCTGVTPWVVPIQSTLKTLTHGYYQGLSTGDTDSAMWCMNVYIAGGFQAGRNLELLKADCDIYIKHMFHFERLKIAKYTQLYSQTMANLALSFERKATDTSWPIVGLDEDLYKDDPIMPNVCKAFCNRLYAFFGLHAEGAELSILRGNSFLTGAPGNCHHVPDAFYRGLSLFAMARKTNKRKYKKYADVQRSLIKQWTKKGCPNTVHFKLILDAEKAALNKDRTKAKSLYEEAVAVATRGGFVHDTALAHERLGEFLLDDMKNLSSASTHFNKAKKLYAQWGANRKVEMMAEKYGDMVGRSRG